MTHPIDRQHAADTFGDYLKTGNREQRDIRKTALRAVLGHCGVDRIVEADDDQLCLMAKALNLGPLMGPVEILRMVPQPQQPYGAASDRLAAKREELKAKDAAKFEAEEKADARGDLFTVVAAYKPDSIFLVIKQGRMDESWHEAFLSQHTDAHMTLDPRAYIADPGEFSKLRALIVQENTGKFTGDVTVRVVLKKKENS